LLFFVQENFLGPCTTFSIFDTYKANFQPSLEIEETRR
jgi:hypothetical protein